MPDPSTTQPPLPSSQDIAATLARLQKTMEAIETPTGQAPAPMAPPAAPAAPGPSVGPAAPVVAPAPVGAPQAGTRPLANAGTALPAPAPKVIDLTQGGLAPQAPKPLERPGSIAAWGQETVAQPLQDKLAARTGDASLAGTPEVQQAVAQARAVQASTTQRIDDFLRARGYDEPVQLIGNGIDLPATIKKMEAAKLTKKAQAMGYGDWFQVPPGVDQARIREEVAQDVADDLRHAATVGRGAIFVNNDPAGSKEFLAQLPPPVAMAATTLLPRATATFTPSGAEFRTESVVQPALRTVGAVSTIAAASGQAALNTGFFDEIQRGWEIDDRAEQLEALGFEDDAAPVRADAEAVRNDALRNALAAATGRTPEQVGDWKTWMFNLSDPEATRALVENVSRDPMLVQATDQMADDLIRIHGLEGKSATALRAALDTGGLLGDFFAPDPVTPTFAAFGAATRAGLRMAAETSDLAEGAKYLREGLAAGQDLRTLIRDADQTYRGLGEALQIRIAAAARVNPDVVSNVRRLQSAAAKAEERVVKAQADLVLARGTAEEAIAARTAAEAQADAAKLQVELTTAHEQFADDVLAQWEAFGEGNLQRAERLQATAMEYKRDAKEAERALQQIDGANAPALTRVDALNKEVVAAQTAVQEAEMAAERAKRAYADLKAFRAEASKGRGFDVEIRRSPYVQTVEEVRKQQTLLVEEADAALEVARAAETAELAQAADAVARARDRLKSARSAKAAKPELEQLRAAVTQAEADLKRLRAGHRDAVELAQTGATQARKVRGIALADARARLKATTDEARASVRGGLADLDEELAFQAQLYKEARQRQAAARDAAKAAAERHRQALQAAAPGFMEQQKAAKRLLDLRTRAAELEQEAGWRILSVADEGKAADEALRGAADTFPSLPESKMRDGQGRLLVGYHASGAAPFSRFEIRTPPPETGAYQGLFGRGVYFADSAETAESWGKTIPGSYYRDHVGEVGSRYRVVMDVRNPLEMAVAKTGRLPADVTTAVPTDFLAALRHELHVVGGDALVAELDRSLRSGRTGWDAVFALEELLPSTHGTDVFRRAAQRAGYDGLIAHLYDDDIAELGVIRFVGDEYAVFDPDKVHILSDAVDVSRVAGEANTGVGVLRKAGLMPNVPPPLDAKRLDDMLVRGQMWGDALREAKAAARTRALEARRAYRETQRVLTGSDKAAQKAADKSLKELTDLAEAQYKNELAAARAAAWRKEVEGLADDIERGLKARGNRPKLLTERTQNVLDGAIIDTAKDGTRTIDTAAFRAKMEKAYSPDAVGWWLRHAGDDKALWERSLGLNGTPQATLSPAEALRLQQGEVGLREGLKRTLPDAQAVAQTEALLALRKDPALRASSFLNTTPNELGRYYAAKWEAWKKTLDPMQAKLGDLDEKLILVSRIGDRKANLASDELLMVGRLAQAKPGLRGLVQWSRGGSREVIRDLGRYIDTTEPIPLFGRASIFNRGEFNESIIDRARRQLLNDPAVVKPQEGEAAAEALGGASREDVVKIASRPMLGISRIWLPANVGINARQSGQLWKAAVQELERQTTFKGLLDAMERRTLGIVGSVDHIPDRPASYLARCLSQAAVQADIADVMVRELGGILKAEEAADVNRILTYDWDRIQSPQAAWEGLARMGQPFTQTATRTSREAVAQQQALVRIATTRGGEDVVAMASQARALDDTLDKVVKETHAHYSAARTPQEALALKHALDLQAFWKSSVTIGLVVPNPRYFINNIFGNISQIWLTQGLGTATRTVGQSLFHNLPFVGPLMERALDQAATRVGDVPFLGSMVEALWNPNVTKILGGQKGAFTATNGIVYDLETVGRWASEDGVFTSFMQEEYGRLFRRARGQGPLTRLRYLQDDIFAWANEIEVRQRTALYVDLLRQGYSRSAARERTLRALYDWEGALGGAEAAVMTTLIPFYRFMKLGFRQAWYEAVAKPLIHPEIATLEALTGSSGLARMRNQAELLRLPELADDGDYQTEADKFDAMARYRNLDYLNKRIQWTERNDPERIAMYQGTRSQFAPYSTVNLPALTAIDMGNLVTLSLYALPAVALAASGSDLVPPNASQPFWDEATNLVGPLAAPLLGQFAQISGADSQTTREVVRLKPGEAATAQMLGLGVGWGLDRVGAHDLAQTAREKLDFTNVGLDYQGTYGTAFTKMMVTSMPGLLQFPQWYDALYGENPVVRAAQEKGQVDLSDVVPYFTWASTQLTGVMRRTPFNPDDVLTRHQNKLRDELNRVAEKETGPLRERQAVKP